ncbi:MAG: 4a-hydroxytetrahydrobiopterin dehydratase [Planctomycetes bacterium]|nr:4a-hydroxytetrahydrobiopterin dehydratase [Planctomycetota bacterium]
MTQLTKRKCVPCEGGVPKLDRKQAEALLKQVDNWALSSDGNHLKKEFAFKDFVENMAFINRVAAIAEAEGHHPDFTVHYNRVAFDIWTHAIGGLSENDFILAAKIDQAVKG